MTSTARSLASTLVLLTALASSARPLAASAVEYRVLATSKTSTMQKEMIEAAGAGFRFAGVMGGETSFGGGEVVTVMQRDTEGAAEAAARYDYRLLATSKTSTMQKEMQEAADAGYHYVGQTVFASAFGGDEVVVILERSPSAAAPGKEQVLLLATSKTSTMQKELQEAGKQGYRLAGMTVSKTKFAGNEIISILRRPAEAAARP